MSVTRTSARRARPSAPKAGGLRAILRSASYPGTTEDALPRYLLRLAALALCLLASAWPGQTALAAPPAFGLDALAARAEILAKRPFRDSGRNIPRWLLGIGYDQWREIRYRPDRALWRERRLPFSVQFFHPGLIYDRTVRINVVEADGVHAVPFSPDLFDYGHTDFVSRVPQDLGFAGFRVHYPINKPSYQDEVIVFLGATYLRAVGKDLGFGLSARGLAIDTGLSSGEEFPFFKEFWLVSPGRRARELEVFALLDSPRLTGAYRFVISPGAETAVKTEVRIFLREEVEKIGLAPLTAMFLHGETTPARPDDYRPEVHDADGLLLSSATGEWIWRPLDNPPRLRISALRLDHPLGFGLIQRDRDFEHYQDLETRQELRPSAWVAPHGDWGEGRVELVEIPTSSEANDNIVAYWVPDRRSAPGKPLAFAYRLGWYRDHPERPPGGRAVWTRRDRGTHEDTVRFVVDFEGKRLRAIPEDAVVRGNVTVGRNEEPAELLEQQVFKNAVTGGWRLVFQVRPQGNEPVELRAFLQRGKDALTETWSYVLEP